LALAWLLHYGKEGETLPRWPFESFWEALASEREHDRWSAVNAATNAIYLHLGVPRDRARQSHFEAAARSARQARPARLREG
jgi:hypothetical protein